MQVLFNVDAFKRESILAVVGVLQFDVVQARLQAEYNVPTSFEYQSIALARWGKGPEKSILKVADRSNVHLCLDADQEYVALFTEAFYLKWTSEKLPELTFETKK